MLFQLKCSLLSRPRPSSQGPCSSIALERIACLSSVLFNAKVRGSPERWSRVELCPTPHFPGRFLRPLVTHPGCTESARSTPCPQDEGPQQSLDFSSRTRISWGHCACSFLGEDVVLLCVTQFPPSPGRGGPSAWWVRAESRAPAWPRERRRVH